MSATTILRAAQAETRPCVITGCDVQLPVRVSCVPRGDGLYTVTTDLDQERLVEHLATHRHTDCGSVLTSLVLFVCIFGALLLLAAGYGQAQRAMCALHHDRLQYCPTYVQETAR